MKVKLLGTLILSIIFFACLASVAGAQTACNMIIFSTDTGAPGTTVDVSGDAPAQTLNGVNILWDGTQIVTLDVQSAWSTSFAVPADATPGTHTVTIQILEFPSGENDCAFDFTVPGPVQEQAYATAPVTALPDTGFFLIVPAAGAALGGTAILMRRRKHE